MVWCGLSCKLAPCGFQFIACGVSGHASSHHVPTGFPPRPCAHAGFLTLSSAPTDATMDPSALMLTASTALEWARGIVCTVLPESFSNTQIMPAWVHRRGGCICAWLHGCMGTWVPGCMVAWACEVIRCVLCAVAHTSTQGQVPKELHCELHMHITGKVMARKFAVSYRAHLRRGKCRVTSHHGCPR